jgi:hypothetical protein
MKSAEQPGMPKGGILKMICPRNDKKGCSSDPRRNATSDGWADSTVGKQWQAHGFSALPKSEDITVVS